MFLSHPWGPSCPPYANGSRVIIEADKCMSAGSSCNSLTFSAPNHIGTHFDFPLHFTGNGKSVEDYEANDFVFNRVACLWLTSLKAGALITRDLVASQIEELAPPPNLDMLLIRTGSSIFRNEARYWAEGIGIGRGVADFLRDLFPDLRAVGIDTISISSLPHRYVGRDVHREFLCHESRPLLIIEDMQLEALSRCKISQVIALPLRIEKGDGAPCTVIAASEPA